MHLQHTEVEKSITLRFTTTYMYTEKKSASMCAVNRILKIKYYRISAALKSLTWADTFCN